MLVVGAPNSSNSNRLREIAAEFGVPSYLIEDANALDPRWLDGVSAVGITAGASAPDELVEELVERLRRDGEIEVERLSGVTENVRFRMPSQLAEPPGSRATTKPSSDNEDFRGHFAASEDSRRRLCREPAPARASSAIRWC